MSTDNANIYHPLRNHKISYRMKNQLFKLQDSQNQQTSNVKKSTRSIQTALLRYCNSVRPHLWVL